MITGLSKNLILAIAYFIAGKLGLEMALVHTNVTLIWPASGIALAAVLIYGYRVLPGVALGAFALNFSTEADLLTSAAIAIGNTTEAFLGLLLLKRFADFQPSLERGKDVLSLIVFGAFVCTISAATIGTTALYLGGSLSQQSLGLAWSQWWLGDALGVVVVTPVILAWYASPVVSFRSARLFEAIILIGALVGLGILGFFSVKPAEQLPAPFTFLIFPAMVLIAIRFGIRETATAILLISIAAVWGTVQGLGPFVAANGLKESYFLIHGFMATSALTALLLAATNFERKKAEHELKRNQQELNDFFENATIALHWAGPDGTILRANQAELELLGYTAEEYIGHNIADFYVDKELIQDILKRLRSDETIHNMEVKLRAKDGLIKHVLISSNVFWDRGVFVHTRCFTRDITERRQVEQQLYLAANALENTAEGVMITDVDRRIVSVNSAFTRITGYASEEVIGKVPSFLRSPEHDDGVYTEMLETVKRTGHWQGEVWRRRKSGELYPELLTITAVKNPAGETTHYVRIFNDISRLKQDEARLEFLAHHDALTKLPNRAHFVERSEQAVLRARRYDNLVGLLFIDLDNFKTINDSMGHLVGDKLLQGVAERITSSTRGADTVARLGGDEFIVMLEEIKDTQELALVAQKLVDSFAKPFFVDRKEIFITASIGISCYPQDGTDVETLLKNADNAMYHVKEQGRNAYQFFSVEMNTEAFEALMMSSSLKLALDRKEFILYYLPRIDFASKKITGVEALIRWQHAELGLMLPIKFIFLAEDTGMIEPIGEWVLKAACEQTKAWQMAGLPHVRIAVNLSARQFRQPQLVKRIQNILLETGLEPSWLELEITESVIMQDPKTTEKTLKELHAMGISIVIDDFGTGGASVSYLKRFPIDALKIDRSFIQDIPGDEEKVAITKALISMAKTLKFSIIAEGVETKEQNDFLLAEGCDEFQGYIFSEPCTAKDFEKILKNNAVKKQKVLS